VPGSRDLEEDAALLLEKDLPVVEGARHTGQSEVLGELIDRETLERSPVAVDTGVRSVPGRP